jgi:small subunit ribosomal protein S6
MRTYELMFVVDPRVSDEDVVGMTSDYKQMIEAGGSQITREESWGRRKLAYPINKVNEGKYVLFYIQSEGGKTSLASVEHRMRQNDKILRYLTVRTDLGLKRAGSRLSPSSPMNVGADGTPAGPPPEGRESRYEGRGERGERGEGRYDRDRGDRGDRGEGRYEGRREGGPGREE